MHLNSKRSMLRVPAENILIAEIVIIRVKLCEVKMCESKGVTPTVE